MDIDPRYLYLLVSAVLSIVWVSLFILRRDLRVQNLSVSLLVGTLTFFFAPLFLESYWIPQTVFSGTFNIEDFLFGFFTAGICSTIHEATFGKYFRKKRNNNRRWGILLFPLVGINLFIFVLQIYTWGINPIYAHISSLVLLAVIFIFLRHDLLVDSVFSGFSFGIIYILVFLSFLFVAPDSVRGWWQTDQLSGMYLVGIPMEELLWAFAWGMCCGPFYEFFSGQVYKKG